jgi:hypothetical protein
MVKTSGGTKRPGEQNIRRVKMSGRTKYPADKTSDGQNIWWDKTSGNITSADKTSVGTKRRRQNVCLGHIKQGHARQYMFTDKSLEPGGKIRLNNALSLCPARGGGKYTYLTEVLYIYYIIY